MFNFNYKHAQLLRSNNELSECQTDLSCPNGLCVNFGFLVNDLLQDVCICQPGYFGPNCQYRNLKKETYIQFQNFKLSINFSRFLDAGSVLKFQFSIINFRQAGSSKYKKDIEEGDGDADFFDSSKIEPSGKLTNTLLMFIMLGLFVLFAYTYSINKINAADIQQIRSTQIANSMKTSTSPKVSPTRSRTNSYCTLLDTTTCTSPKLIDVAENLKKIRTASAPE